MNVRSLYTHTQLVQEKIPRAIDGPKQHTVTYVATYTITPATMQR